MTNEQKQSRIAELDAIISAAKSEIKGLRRTMPRNKCEKRCSSCALLKSFYPFGSNRKDCRCPYRNFPSKAQKACDNHKPIVEANESK